MNKKRPTGDEGVAVPSQRLARIARFGALGAGIAGNVVAEGAQRLARGERPSLQDLVLSPANARKAADQLSRLRGAAMKLGQLLSMDGGDFIPPEFAEPLERLRASAHEMPGRQLKAVLTENWGPRWITRFKSFDVKPIAAASIGQVHRATTRDGRTLALKIQYPGVRESIDSDIDNLAGIIGMSGAIPKDVDLKPLFAELKKQLKEEADYEREAARLKSFAEILNGSDDFITPDVHDDFTTKNILAMSYLGGAPIESLSDAPQEVRNQAVTRLIDLTLRELLHYRLMQTDPNFANFFVDEQTGKIILLDFGAARDIEPALSDGYRALLTAAINGDTDEALNIAKDLGFVGDTLATDHETLMREVFDLAGAPLRQDGPFDFGGTDLGVKLRDKAFALRQAGFAHPPPPPAVFIHRKFGGLYLLATRLNAHVEIGALARRHLTTTP
ncbi:MAG: AarF/ABC1/UbiB kinase family protein [Pseudomonadota bacterium]